MLRRECLRFCFRIEREWVGIKWVCVVQIFPCCVRFGGGADVFIDFVVVGFACVVRMTHLFCRFDFDVTNASISTFPVRVVG